MNGSFKQLFSKIRESLSYKQAKVKLDFTLQLESLMNKNSINKSDLARRINKSNPYVTKIMKGESNLTIDSMVALADAVGGKIELHITPKEEEVVAWYRSVKTGRPNQRHLHRVMVEIESCDSRSIDTDPHPEYFKRYGENGYSVAA